ncbi:helix-turn-helix transcriptional regulator [Ferrovibrio sp.]|jgi:AraC-like DNA-binding protein|uniref:AraC family transcriptional regulator n=1 Tax=Ferrovibrio sp. TaxID=1917215 RepID=UPI0035B44D1F
MSEDTTSPPIPRASLAPGLVPEDQLALLWRNSIAPYFDARPVPDAEHSPQLPEIHLYNLGEMLWAESRFSAQIYDRNPQWMRQHDDSDHLLLQLFVTGENRAINGTDEFVQQPGNVCAINLAREALSVSTDAHALTLVLPRDLLRAELPHLLDAKGVILAPGSASARIFADHFMSLQANLAHATVAEAPILTRATLALLEALTLRHDIASAASGQAAFKSACRYIDRHLGNPDLGVDDICRHLRFSRATLYRLFSAHGGVHEHIRRRRLVACFNAVSSPEYRHRGIFDIALDFGFTSPSHFSSLFRRHFGMAPREVRDAALAGGGRLAPLPSPGSDGEDAVRQMWNWAATLTGQARR